MSQRRRRRAKLPVAPPPVAPSSEEPVEQIEPAEPVFEERVDVVSPAQSQVVAYGLTIAVIAMLLVCAVAVYIAAP
jgi:hypothetical protein